ncbi:MAG: hypothetical protein IT380_09715 [Myxococcales bacterium]|nr:hypothetical protein [Myxococcales bacterium]
MSLFLTGGVALAYAAGVVGLHRYTVHRRRVSAQHFATLRWLDWDTLLFGLVPDAPRAEVPAPAPPEGGPPPLVLQREASEANRGELELLSRLVTGGALSPETLQGTRFSGGEQRWVEVLATFRGDPRATLERLQAGPANSVAEAYLREWLALTHTATPFNLELLVFGSKRRVNEALGRFGDHPALYFVRAHASAVLGFTGAVLDDLARAVYFSREAPFYLQAVLQLPFIEEARPALVRACREVRAR